MEDKYGDERCNHGKNWGPSTRFGNKGGRALKLGKKGGRGLQQGKNSGPSAKIRIIERRVRDRLGGQRWGYFFKI